MIIVDCTRPLNLYRYSRLKWLELAIKEGAFLLKPASSYQDLGNDPARQDNELVRQRKSPPEQVNIFAPRLGQQIRPIGPVTYTNTSLTDYLVLCFSSRWGADLFQAFPGSDSCLIIHRVEEFAEMLHRSVEDELPGWVGIDAAVSYGAKNNLGVPFSKPERHANQSEFRFAWRPPDPVTNVDPVPIRIGCLKDIAEIRLSALNSAGYISS